MSTLSMSQSVQEWQANPQTTAQRWYYLYDGENANELQYSASEARQIQGGVLGAEQWVVSILPSYATPLEAKHNEHFSSKPGHEAHLWGQYVEELLGAPQAASQVYSSSETKGKTGTVWGLTDEQYSMVDLDTNRRACSSEEVLKQAMESQNQANLGEDLFMALTCEVSGEAPEVWRGSKHLMKLDQTKGLSTSTMLVNSHDK